MPPTWTDAKHILCLRLDTIGDLLMTTPAIRALKQSQPGRHITLMTSPAGAQVAPFIPEVDDTLIYDAPWMKATAHRPNSQTERAMADQLRQAGFDAAVIFTTFSQSPLPAAFLCYLAEIPLRLAHCHENPYQLLTDWLRDLEPTQFIRHEVRRHLDLVASVGGRTADDRLSLKVPAGAPNRVQRLLEERGVDVERPFLVMHPGVSAPSRQYPPEQFAEVARLLAVEHGWQILFTGSGAEDALVAGIQQEMGVPSVSLANALDLGELGALLHLSPLLIANNTGPVHVAAAVGTPVVDLYALTNPQHTPWAVPHRVLFHDVPCKYCFKSVCPEGHHNCLRLVTPHEVVQAVQELLAQAHTFAPQPLTEVLP
ncbi:MAG: lipopolysaccharide heptosyltransferase II [Anaerolineaceae bacterium]|nr:lipopolysaccharide heptosyltransferase II [Anaerolineaceae bacterium]